MKAKNWNILFMLIGLAMLTWLIYDFGIAKIVSNIKQTGWWFFPITGIWFFIYLLNTWAWVIILGEGNGHSFRRLFSLNISGFALNYMTPVVGFGGEPYKVINIKKQIGIHKASSSVILYNMMHILSHFYFWLTSIVLVVFFTHFTTTTYILLGLTFVIMLLLIALFYAWHKKGVVYNALKFLSKIPFLVKPISKLLANNQSLNTIDEHIKELYNFRKTDFYKILTIEYLARFIGCLEFYFILKAISFDIALVDAIYISAAYSLIANIFFFIPLQLGTREGSLYLVFDSLKFTPAIGIFVSLVTRIREFFWILIGLVLMRITLAINKKTGYTIYNE
jgi:uncharacterized membrane protein YbhN (UPF0104 family)